ncbi:MAG TPA: DUF6051 family protein, partial [Ignavibacteriales bacterium]|nr:DUF6051 family protein [Ignavibacteriales bacterium]
MLYQQLYEILRDHFEKIDDEVIIPEISIKITKKHLDSTALDILPGSPRFCCEEHKAGFQSNDNSHYITI